MKKKFYKVLGVALTAMLLSSLFVGLAASPAAAGANIWSPFDTPVEGQDGDWFMESSAEAGPGPMDVALDGTLFAYWDVDEDTNLFRSTNGREWTMCGNPTDDIVDVVIVDIVCSSLDADIIYVTGFYDDDDDRNFDPGDGDFYGVFKSKNQGRSFDTLGSLHTSIPEAGEISCMDVGYIEEAAYVFIGTVGDAGTEEGGVYVLQEAVYGGAWTDTLLADATAHGWDAEDTYVWDIAVSREFEEDQMVMAVVLNTDEANTYVSYKYSGGEWGATEDDAVFDPDGAATEVDESTSAVIWLPDDFSSDDTSGMFELYVGIASDDPDEGDVYRIVIDGAFDRDIGGQPVSARNVTALDGVGGVGGELMLAGTDQAIVYYSTAPGGADWDINDKRPTGEMASAIICADDFEDSGEAWVACSGDDGAVSLTHDGGETHNQVGLIDVDCDYIVDFEPSPNYADDDTCFMVTSEDEFPFDSPDGYWLPQDGDSLWKWDGDYWERISHTSLYPTGAPDEYYDISDVEVSPEFATDDVVVFADRDRARGFRSRDGGALFRAALSSPLGVPSNWVTCWLVIDSSTPLSASIVAT
jgi:hypothetical protein